MSSITVKTALVSSRGIVDVRRVRLSGGGSYGQLVQFIGSVYGPSYGLDISNPKSFSLSYVDPDGDECSITTEVELIEAIRCSAEEKKTVKITVKTKDSPNNSNTLVMEAPSRGISAASDISSLSATAPSVPVVGLINNRVGNNDGDHDDYVQVNGGESTPTTTSTAAPPSSTVGDITAGLSLTSIGATNETKGGEVTVEDVTEDEVHQQQALMNDIIQNTTTGAAISTSTSTPSGTSSSPTITTNSNTAASSSTSATATGPAVHTNIICDGCNTHPIIGDRYKCTVCRDYDLCANCEASGRHNQDHPLLKIKTPDAAPHRFGRHGGWGHHGGHWARHHGPHHGPFAHHGPPGPLGVPPSLGGPSVGIGPNNMSYCSSDGNWRSGSCGRRFGPHQFRQFAEAASEVAQDLGFSSVAGDDRPKATFVSDVTLADGVIVKPGQVLQKIWKVKNTGDKAWPEGTRLVFIGGDVAPAANANNDNSFADSAIVPAAAPNESVNLIIDVVTPQELGRVRGTFRLVTSDGVRFGPRMWIDVTVSNQETSAASTSTSTSSASSSASSSSSSSSSASTSTSSDSRYVDEEKSGPAAPNAANQSGDGLDHNAIRNAISSVLNSLGSGNGQNAIQAVVQAFSQVVAGNAPTSNAFATTNTSTPASAPVSDNGVYPYAHQLELIRSMGFKYDDSVIKAALERNRGHVARTVNMLLNQQ